MDQVESVLGLKLGPTVVHDVILELEVANLHTLLPQCYVMLQKICVKEGTLPVDECMKVMFISLKGPQRRVRGSVQVNLCCIEEDVEQR